MGRVSLCVIVIADQSDAYFIPAHAAPQPQGTRHRSDHIAHGRPGAVRSGHHFGLGRIIPILRAGNWPTGLIPIRTMPGSRLPEGKQPVAQRHDRHVEYQRHCRWQYALRLRVIRKDSNYSEGFVRGLQVSNSAPVGTPTSIPPARHFPGRAAYLARPREAAQPIATVMVEQPPTSVPEARRVRPMRAADQRDVTPQYDGCRRQFRCQAVRFGLPERVVALTVGLFVVLGVIQAGRWGVKQFRRSQKRRP